MQKIVIVTIKNSKKTTKFLKKASKIIKSKNNSYYKSSRESIVNVSWFLEKFQITLPDFSKRRPGNKLL